KQLSANLRNVTEFEFARKVSSHGDLVGGIEDGSAGSHAARDFEAEIESGKGGSIGGLKVERKGTVPVHFRADPFPAFGVGKGVLDGEFHVGRGELGDHGPVDE